MSFLTDLQRILIMKIMVSSFSCEGPSIRQDNDIIYTLFCAALHCNVLFRMCFVVEVLELEV